ncbi:MAG TPA: hypothetical protein VF188_18515 [Longimicrobiales bacterium]
MRFELDQLEPRAVSRRVVTICRIPADGTRWRVVVETWEDMGGWRGRLAFQPDSPETRADTRWGPVTLSGRTPTDILDVVHRLPERRLREVLHSLG